MMTRPNDTGVFAVPNNDMSHIVTEPLPSRIAGSYESVDVLKSTQWSADGTCVVTNGEDHVSKTFVLPTDLLTSTNKHALQPYNNITSPGPVIATALYPFYQLSDASTTLILSSIRDHPIRLHSTLQTQQAASYPLIHAPTETHITPNSLVFTSAGAHFIAGSRDLLSCFDINRPGQEPIESYPTIPPKRSKTFNHEPSMKGIISALTISSERILAAGTFSRHIGLYSDEGRGGCVSGFSLGQDSAITGSGITQTAWSPDGRYLFVAERMSDSILVYDIRVEGRLLGQLTGRKASTQQRLGFDIVPTQEGLEIWAGGTDGVVRVWKDPHLAEGNLESSFQWTAHEDAVSSAVVHPTGCVVATCSGSRKLSDTDRTTWHASSSNASDDDETARPQNDRLFLDGAQAPLYSIHTSRTRTTDYSLKLWAI